MTILKAHFDGKVLVPDEPVDLPLNCALEVHVQPVSSPKSGASPDSDAERPLARLVEILKQYPADPDWPEDGAAQHDHYLYGTPKRP